MGNDLSCRKFQLPSNSGGQFFFAKAFDKFAPIGPTLISPELFSDGAGFEVVTRVNGQVRQRADLKTDMVFSPEKILSHMSQGAFLAQPSSPFTDFPFPLTSLVLADRYHNSCRDRCHDRHPCRRWRVSTSKSISPAWRCGGSRDAKGWNPEEQN